MTTRTKAWTAILGAALAAATGGRARAADGLVPAIEQVGVPAGGPGLWRVSAGVRSSLFRSAGYDAFATDDTFTQFSATATRTVVAGSRLSSAAGLLWEDGSSDATARGAPSSFSLMRFGLLLEERFAPRPWAYVLVRAAPTWLRGEASIDDVAIAAPLRTSFSTFGLDASVGAAARLNPHSGPVGLWLMGDGGYGWAQEQPVALAPALPTADRTKAGVTTLADLAPRGIFFRFALALSY